MDIDRAIKIYGVPEPLLRGKKVAPAQSSARGIQVDLPPTITNELKRIQLFVDIFYVNGLAFLHTKAKNQGVHRHLNYITINHLKNKKSQTIIMFLKKVLRLLRARDFKVTVIHGDNEFNVESIKDACVPSSFHICAKNEHIPVIERSIRTVKERARCTCHSIPYMCYPKIMTIALMEQIEYWLNSFPSTDSLVDSVGPANIVEGRPNVDCRKNFIPFGSYAMLYIGTSNTMEARSVPVIALNNANDFGGYYFFSLETGKRLHGKEWDILPINNHVIDTVNTYGGDQHQPVIKNRTPVFEWAPGIEIDVNDEEADLDNEPAIVDFEVNPNEDIEANDNQIMVTDDEDNSLASESTSDYEDSLRDEGPPEDILPFVEHFEDDVEHGNDDAVSECMPEEERNEEPNRDGIVLEESLISDGSNDDIYDPEDMNDANVSINSDDYSEKDMDSDDGDSAFDGVLDTMIDELDTAVNSRPKRSNAGEGVDRLEMTFTGKQYPAYQSKMFAMKRLVEVEKKSAAKNLVFTPQAIVKVIFTQMSAKMGIRKHGEKAIAAMFKELNQLDKGAKKGNPVVIPQNPHLLTAKEKREALEAVNLIKEKRCGKIKGRTCANGARQRRYLKEGEDYYSPTTSLESILSTMIIDAYEERDVAIADIPGAYLHAEMPKGKNVLLKLEGEFVDIMCSVNPEHTENIVYELKGRKMVKVVYQKVLRALCGCLE